MERVGRATWPAKPRGQRSSVAGATETMERSERKESDVYGRCCAGLDFQPKLLRAREMAGTVDDKWHGSGYLSWSAQPIHALALAMALYHTGGERHFRSCACVFFTGAIGSCCQQNLEQHRHRFQCWRELGRDCSRRRRRRRFQFCRDHAT